MTIEMIDNQTRVRCDHCRQLVKKGERPVNLTLAGTCKDGFYEFCNQTCKDRFVDYFFQMPLLYVPDNPYSNTGVLFSEKGES